MDENNQQTNESIIMQESLNQELSENALNSNYRATPFSNYSIFPKKEISVSDVKESEIGKIMDSLKIDSYYSKKHLRNKSNAWVNEKIAELIKEEFSKTSDVNLLHVLQLSESTSVKDESFVKSICNLDSMKEVHLCFLATIVLFLAPRLILETFTFITDKNIWKNACIAHLSIWKTYKIPFYDQQNATCHKLYKEPEDLLFEKLYGHSLWHKQKIKPLWFST